TEAKKSLYTFWMDTSDGQMVLLSIVEEPCMNPAFARFHPTENTLYTCTESIAEEGAIDSWKVDPKSGRLSKLGSCKAGGTSTCYITLDKACRNMLVVNYWNGTIGVFGIDKASGSVSAMRSMFDPNNGKPMKVPAASLAGCEMPLIGAAAPVQSDVFRSEVGSGLGLVSCSASQPVEFMKPLRREDLN
ncbi:unnamed protein product, partial [Polarella glacialis]